MSARHYTTVGDKKYVVILAEVLGRPVVWPRVVRKQADGTEVEAFMSARQHKAEAMIRRRFAKEINEHLAKFN